MGSRPKFKAVEVGIVSHQPMRVEGLMTIFDMPARDGNPPLRPVSGSLQQMLASSSIEYLVIDIEGDPGGVSILDSVRRVRPNMKLILFGPEGNDELVLEAIIGGARAYLDIAADVETARRAIDVVTSGSIWAPPRLLSKLIDRLLKLPDSSLTNGATPYLTDREKEVLELILMAQSNREIARALGIEERTVKAHVGRLMRKTGSDNRVELTMRALNSQLFTSVQTPAHKHVSE
jgi:DNA-binding NarL/FixJ family response regulator